MEPQGVYESYIPESGEDSSYIKHDEGRQLTFEGQIHGACSCRKRQETDSENKHK